MWYEKAYRRHLCDMHIADWDPRFLSEFDPEAYVENLKKARIQGAMIYLQSHAGLCYYPTKSGRMHRAFEGREDAVRRLTELCRKEGIAVIGYYSLNYNTEEHDRHPEWRMLMPNGKSRRENGGGSDNTEFAGSQQIARYGLCCPNNPEYRAFVKEQIREIAEYFTVDGMFYDMLFWPHLCYCPHCKARYAAEVGGEIPTEADWKDPRWLAHMHRRRVWMGEWAQWVTDCTKELMPGVTVEHNAAPAANQVPNAGHGMEVLTACDYVGGDLYKNCFGHSYACKFYRSVTKVQPFEYMFTRCAPDLSRHTQLKSKDVMRSAVFITAAHHGATLVIDAIDPVGTLDERVYRQVGEVFEEEIPYEPYLTGEMIEDVGLYDSIRSRFCAEYQPGNNFTGVVNAVETLVSAHIPCGVTGSYGDLSGYPILAAPCLTSEDAFDNGRLVQYVENGGSLYISGTSDPELLKTFFGAKVVARTEETVVYIAPKEKALSVFDGYSAKYPLHFDGTAPVVEGIDPATVLATVTLPHTATRSAVFASIHSDPPGRATEMPAVAMTKYGKGAVLWSAMPIECVEQYDYRRIFQKLLALLPGFSRRLQTDAPDDVEITLFRTEGGIQVNAVLLNENHTARRVADFDVSVEAETKPQSVVRIPDGKPIPFTWDGKSVTFTVENLHVFAMYEIQF